MKILLLSVIYNEETLIPFFLRHYSEVSKFLFIDWQSTDKTIELIENSPFNATVIPDRDFTEVADSRLTEIKNKFWLPFRNEYDYILICDVDEFLYFPGGLKKLISEMEFENCNIIKPLGFQMVGDKFPAPDKVLIEELNKGVPDEMYGKSVLFKSFIEPNYNHGCHELNPVPSNEIRYFKHRDLKLLHYKYVDIERQIKKKNETFKRQSQENKDNGWGVQYAQTDEVWRKVFEVFKQKAEIVI